MQDFIIHHNQQYILELDANLSPQLLLKVLTYHVKPIWASKCSSDVHIMKTKSSNTLFMYTGLERQGLITTVLSGWFLCF